jgi:hypothetical protein
MTMQDLFDDFDADNDNYEDWDVFPMTFEDYAVSACKQRSTQAQWFTLCLV